MVLESIITPLKAEKTPLRLFFIGFMYSTVGLFLSLWVFSEHASLVMVFFTVFACVPLLYSTMKLEEEKDIQIEDEKTLLKEHSKALAFLIMLFFGMVIAFSLWYTLLPAQTANTLFKVQTQMILNLNQQVTGNVTNLALFSKIFLNNLKVLIFCILFSFLYGAGAIFILTWNASVIGVAIGNFVRTHLSTYASHLGLSNISSYFYAASMGLLRYSLHGIPEILAYFIAGLAGGIISVAVIKHNYSTKAFERILLDSSDLIIGAIFILFIAALIEVYITPAFF
ncbi:stage II sporulation protein M [Candidatus Woesearchaeota archaeon]|nr:stage II sporulation protein M [Candidatus Woesearchaeota archaeon]